MIKRITVFLLMGQLLIGGMILPLGDFSLLKELPGMYRTYEKAVSPEEKGVLDFVGDYLLGGKTLLGHNQHDQPEKSGAIQFQHMAAFTAVIFERLPRIIPTMSAQKSAVYTALLSGIPSDYHPSLFRPPLA